MARPSKPPETVRMPSRRPLNVEPFINPFIDDLRRREVAELTMMSCWYELVGFGRMFEQTVGEASVFRVDAGYAS
jgi:hypothetical protein